MGRLWWLFRSRTATRYRPVWPRTPGAPTRDFALCESSNGLAYRLRVRLGASAHRIALQAESADRSRCRGEQPPRRLRLLAAAGAAAHSSFANLLLAATMLMLTWRQRCKVTARAMFVVFV